MLELHGTHKNSNGFYTDTDYWDCECDDNYIHKKTSGNYCPHCNQFMEENPDARVTEITKHYHGYVSDRYIQNKVYEGRD